MQESNPRKERGMEIANKNHLRRIDEYTYKVKSQSSDKEYSVISSELGWNCSCPIIPSERYVVSTFMQ